MRDVHYSAPPSIFFRKFQDKIENKKFGNDNQNDVKIQMKNLTRYCYTFNMKIYQKMNRTFYFFTSLLISCLFAITIQRHTSVASAFSTVVPGRISYITKNRVSTQLKDTSDPPAYDAEVVSDDEFDDAMDWMPDGEKARILRDNKWKAAEASPADFYGNSSGSATTQPQSQTSDKKGKNADDLLSPKRKRLTYTDEEEELIEILGGKDPDSPSPKRESGFLGDCTLKEIALDYQVPICYLGDVLCGWGVPAPIDPGGMLGDMITGEQAFAILEAIHTLDMGSLNERYGDYDLVTLCNEYDIELADGFELAMKNGWNLPFGVRTFLRVEQEEELIDRLAKDVW